jgi:hypothetical protein
LYLECLECPGRYQLRPENLYPEHLGILGHSSLERLGILGHSCPEDLGSPVFLANLEFLV